MSFAWHVDTPLEHVALVLIVAAVFVVLVLAAAELARPD